MSASFLAKVEQGLHSPHAASLLSLSSIYHIPIELLMDHLRLDLWLDERTTEEDVESLHQEGRERLVRNDVEGAKACLARAADLYRVRMAADADDAVAGRYQELCLDLAITLIRSGMRYASESYLKRVLEPPRAPDKLRAYALYYLGIVYMESGTRELAQLAAKSARETAQLIEDEGLALSCTTLLAGVDRAEGRFDEARRAQKYCWHQFKALDQAASAAIARASYGYCTVRQGIEESDREMIDEGLAQQRHALRDGSITSDAPRSCRILISYGMSLFEAGTSGLEGCRGHLSKARTELGRANRRARDLKLVLLEFDSRFYLWKVVQELGGKERSHLDSLAKLRPKLPNPTPEAREFDRLMLSGPSD